MSGQVPVPADMPLSVTLPARLWQVVMGQLAKGSIETTGPAYGEIDRQLQQQVEQQQRANGEERIHAN